MAAHPQAVPALETHARWSSLIILLVVTFAAAALGAWASVSAPVFYAQLQKPSWAPPAGVFGPVWTVLYSMMTAAAWLVVRHRGWRAARWPVTLYLLQLVLNAWWSWWFFGWHIGIGAQVDVVLLWLSVLATVIVFWRVKRLAGLLLLPYLAWVSFASVLTFVVCQLNPDLL